MTDRSSTSLARARRSLSVSLLAFVIVSCHDADASQVRIEAVPATERDARDMDIRAQFAGPVAGVRYKWFSVTGETDPQESEQPATVFTFADGATKDRVTVEVWRGKKRLARNELDVKLDETRVILANAERPKMQIDINVIPPYEPYGGAETRADIGGKIVGDSVAEYRVIIYARADLWYRQPMPDVSVPIGMDGTWKTWTHTGASYAVFVVRHDVGLSTRLDVLPHVGGNIVASRIVDGVRKN
ncbi:MAG: hypothetical protein ABI664_02815 [bacterium]